jgi:hypothetical protein
MRLTDIDEIAKLVSGVTETMCGARFAAWDPLARGESLSGRMVLMSLVGPRPIRIALACDAQGSRALAAAMFQCAPAEVTPARIDDAIRELLNVVAGQVQRSVGINQPLGMPRPTTLAELGGPGIQDAVLLRSHGEVDIRLWIFEDMKSGTGGPGPEVAPARSRFRSLIKRLVH